MIDLLYGIKCGRKFLSSYHNTRFWQTEGRTDCLSHRRFFMANKWYRPV